MCFQQNLNQDCSLHAYNMQRGQDSKNSALLVTTPLLSISHPEDVAWQCELRMLQGIGSTGNLGYWYQTLESAELEKVGMNEIKARGNGGNGEGSNDWVRTRKESRNGGRQEQRCCKGVHAL